jgi:hypothetical protein
MDKKKETFASYVRLVHMVTKSIFDSGVIGHGNKTKEENGILKTLAAATARPWPEAKTDTEQISQMWCKNESTQPNVNTNFPLYFNKITTDLWRSPSFLPHLIRIKKLDHGSLLL